MYHRIRDDGKMPDISVSVENFEKQMAYLKNNFNVISLKSLCRNLKQLQALPVDSVAITFDDGYKDNYLNAYPILKKYQLPATVFLISRLIGTDGDMLENREINIMNKGGIDFGSHTLTHPVLSEIDSQTATAEISESKVEIERLLGEEVDFFAYPKGKYNDFNAQIKAQVQASGYKAAFATENGLITTESDLFELKRIGVRNFSMPVFKVRVSGLPESRLVYFFRQLMGIT